MNLIATPKPPGEHVPTAVENPRQGAATTLAGITGMAAKVVVVRAETAPMAGVATPGPHQTYRHPRLSVEERPLGPLASGQIRVEMLFAGICGTDVHLITPQPGSGYVSSSAPCTIPAEGRIIGHEGVGRVLATGDGVHHVRPGNIVTMESIMVCQTCGPCKRGKFNQCLQAKLIGLERDGVFGSVVDLPAMIAHDISALIQDEEDLHALACIEPASVAFVACQNARMLPGGVVAIFGAGPIGALVAMLCRQLFGAAAVHIVEPVAFRRNLARRWADQVYADHLELLASGERFDTLFEASGDLNNVNQLFRRMAANSSVVLLARSGKPFHLAHVDHMITNEISLVGSRGHLAGAFSSILNLYARGKIRPGAVVTRILSGQEQLAAIFRQKETILHDNCKVLVQLNPF